MCATTENLDEYSRFCGPRALAAALDLTPGTTARMLLDVQRRRGLVEAPFTSAETVILACHCLGVPVEVYGAASGERRESAAQSFARACETQPRQPTDKSALHEAIALAPEASRPGMIEHVRNMFAKSLKLSDWLRFRGTWLLDVDAPEFAHWVALREG